MVNSIFLQKLLAGKRVGWWIAGFALFFAVGSVGHHVSHIQPFMLRLTPGFLLMFGTVSLVPSIMKGNRRLLIWIAVAFIVTFVLEVVGVKTGRIFGAYRYGETLGLKLFEVPLVIGFNWVIVVLGMNSLLEIRLESRLLKAVIAATAAMLFDAVLEPVAMHFDYWTWESTKVPLQNYGAWWVIAFGTSLAFLYGGVRVENRITGAYVVVQTAFMASLLPLTF